MISPVNINYNVLKNVTNLVMLWLNYYNLKLVSDDAMVSLLLNCAPNHGIQWTFTGFEIWTTRTKNVKVLIIRMFYLVISFWYVSNTRVNHYLDALLLLFWRLTSFARTCRWMSSWSLYWMFDPYPIVCLATVDH